MSPEELNSLREQLEPALLNTEQEMRRWGRPGGRPNNRSKECLSPRRPDVPRVRKHACSKLRGEGKGGATASLHVLTVWLLLRRWHAGCSARSRWPPSMWRPPRSSTPGT